MTALLLATLGRVHSPWPPERMLSLVYSGAFYCPRRTVVQFVNARGEFVHWDMDAGEWVENFNSAEAYEYRASGSMMEVPR